MKGIEHFFIFCVAIIIGRSLYFHYVLISAYFFNKQYSPKLFLTAVINCLPTIIFFILLKKISTFIKNRTT